MVFNFFMQSFTTTTTTTNLRKYLHTSPTVMLRLSRIEPSILLPYVFFGAEVSKCDVILRIAFFNHLQPTGYVMHHQFNIQQLYALPTLYLCVLYLSENKQRLVPLTA